VTSNNEVGPGASSLWVSWNAHLRTDGLCAAWGVPLQVLRPTLPGALKWLELPLRTLWLWGRERPRILFVQNPSLALTTLAALCRPLFRYRLVVDAHNEGVRPFDRPYASVRWLTRRLLKAADVTIVTNDALADDVRAAGGRPQTLPDSLPAVPEPGPAVRPGRNAADVVVIATYRRDEPIADIMAAAAMLPELSFAFTGPGERYRDDSTPVPPNVRLTGFLDDADYWRLLAQATAVCDLTLKPDCLVCGAYEALAVGRPMVLSDNPPTRDLFGHAAVLTGSSPDAIAAALQTAIDDRERLEARARELRASFSARWQAAADAVWENIEAHCASGRRAAA
jgi:glycosyltransferase involved in cell wall biosynthesis